MEVVTPRDLPTEVTSITNTDSLIEVYDVDLLENVKIKTVNLLGDISVNDISAANVVIALPEVTGYHQKKDIFWNGGDGSHTLTLTVANLEAVGGLSASIWIGEGTGSISLISDGSNWQVKEYIDYITDGGDQKVWKYKDGREEQLISVTENIDISSTSGNIFRSSGVIGAVTRYHALNSLIYCKTSLKVYGGNGVAFVTSGSASTATVTEGVFLADSTSSPAQDYTTVEFSIGRWRA